MPYRAASASKSKSKSKGRKRSGTKRSAPRKKPVASSGKRRGSAKKRSGKKRSTKKRAASSRAKAPARRYTRYDPRTGASARVTNRDPRYDEWMTQAQYRTAKARADKERREAIGAAVSVLPSAIELAGPQLAAGAARAASAARAAKKSVLKAAGTRIASGVVGVGTVGVGTTAALAVLTAAASYFGTRWILDKLHKMRDPAEKASVLAKAFRDSRRRAAAELGRELTAAEVKYLGAELQAQLAKMGIRT